MLAKLEAQWVALLLFNLLALGLHVAGKLWQRWRAPQRLCPGGPLGFYDPWLRETDQAEAEAHRRARSDRGRREAAACGARFARSPLPASGTEFETAYRAEVAHES